MTEQVAQLDVYIKAGSGADGDELAELAVQLRAWLLELDIESADPLIQGTAPPGTRAGEMFVAGALTVMLTRSRELIAKLIKMVQNWISLSAGRSIRIECDGNTLEVKGITVEDQGKLIQFFIDQCADG